MMRLATTLLVISGLASPDVSGLRSRRAYMSRQADTKRLSNLPVSRVGGVEVDAGQISPLDTLYATCPAAPPVEVLDGGWVLMAPTRAGRVACLFETCDAKRKADRDTIAAAPPPALWIVWGASIVMIAVAAYGVGHAVAEQSAPPAR